MPRLSPIGYSIDQGWALEAVRSRHTPLLNGGMHPISIFSRFFMGQKTVDTLAQRPHRCTRTGGDLQSGSLPFRYSAHKGAQP
uniref:Uncharacterized protein n=1 Tax=Timema cristinae TaxID=61476 RepID=A0A7R9CAD7_TIMCR|nr:unnamed protein product [Timema cristinae]